MGRIRHIDGELHCVAKHRDAARFLSNFYVNTVYRGPFFEYTVWTGIEVGTFGPFCCPASPKLCFKTVQTVPYMLCVKISKH